MIAERVETGIVGWLGDDFVGMVPTVSLLLGYMGANMDYSGLLSFPGVVLVLDVGTVAYTACMVVDIGIVAHSVASGLGTVAYMGIDLGTVTYMVADSGTDTYASCVVVG